MSKQLLLKTLINVKKEHLNCVLMAQRTREVQSVVFNLNSLSEHELLTDYRFKLAEIGKIANFLGWNGATLRNRYVCEPVLATAIMCFRLANTQKLFSTETKFGFFSSQLSEIFWEHVELLIEQAGDKLNINGNLLINRADLYANAIHSEGAHLDSCVAFIDCTKIKMQRPSGSRRYQQSCYSGHKRFHCLTYQTLTTPDGLIFGLYGPIVGRRHDLTVLRNSGWEPILENSLYINERQFYIFGDQAYILRPWMIRPFIGENLPPDHAQFNSVMKSIRASVEHSYKDLKQQWTSQDFARNLKVLHAPISMLYKASALLWNFRMCMYSGGQVRKRFDVEPPTFDEYIG